MKAYFEQICNLVSDEQHREQNDDHYLLNFDGELSHFVRFNHGKIRQPTVVDQATLDITWIRDQRQMTHSVDLTLNIDRDRTLVQEVINRLKKDLAVIDPDPYLLYQTDIVNSTVDAETEALDCDAICRDILKLAKGHDQVGLLTCGEQFIGFANSFGQRNGYSFNDLNFDWSIYLGDGGDKAAKSGYVAKRWALEHYTSLFEKSVKEAELLRRDAVTIDRGGYRVYLAPAALSEIIWFTDFSYRTWQDKTNLLQRWHDGFDALSDKVTLKQNGQLGLAPNFQQQGFISQDLTLVDSGRPGSKLISPRSGREYQQAHNGAPERETTYNMEMSPGTLQEADILKQLDNGLYINNLHYTNISDQTSARLTGMTRFACFKVENGQLRSPIGVMRFDDTLYRLLGSELLAVTKTRQPIVNDSTYDKRGRGGKLLPGVLLSDMKFTL